MWVGPQRRQVCEQKFCDPRTHGGYGACDYPQRCRGEACRGIERKAGTKHRILKSRSTFHTFFSLPARTSARAREQALPWFPQYCGNGFRGRKRGLLDPRSPIESKDISFVSFCTLSYMLTRTSILLSSLIFFKVPTMSVHWQVGCMKFKFDRKLLDLWKFLLKNNPSFFFYKQISRAKQILPPTKKDVYDPEISYEPLLHGLFSKLEIGKVCVWTVNSMVINSPFSWKTTWNLHGSLLAYTQHTCTIPIRGFQWPIKPYLLFSSILNPFALFVYLYSNRSNARRTGRNGNQEPNSAKHTLNEKKPSSRK